MSNISISHTGEAVQPFTYRDTYNIGQEACAIIRLDIARAELAKATARLLSTEYEPADTLPMWVRIYRSARADYDTAKGVLS